MLGATDAVVFLAVYVIIAELTKETISCKLVFMFNFAILCFSNALVAFVLCSPIHALKAAIEELNPNIAISNLYLVLQRS